MECHIYMKDPQMLVKMCWEWALKALSTSSQWSIWSIAYLLHKEPIEEKKGRKKEKKMAFKLSGDSKISLKLG